MFLNLLHPLLLVPLLYILGSWKLYNSSARGDTISVITTTILLDFAGKNLKKEDILSANQWWAIGYVVKSFRGSFDGDKNFGSTPVNKAIETIYTVYP